MKQLRPLTQLRRAYSKATSELTAVLKTLRLQCLLPTVCLSGFNHSFMSLPPPLWMILKHDSHDIWCDVAASLRYGR